MKIHQAGDTPYELDHTELAPAATAYINFLSRTPHTGLLAEIVAAMLPCAWAYSETGNMRIGQNGAGLEPPVYGEWIRTYADEVFIRLVALMEELTVNFSPAELDRLEQRLITASRYEFWKMG